jgi:hypothetical protein
MCGAFLRAPRGEICFRLHIAGRDQVFAADFREAAECGSQKIALVEKLGPSVIVRLEILDVTAPVNMPDTWHPDLSAVLRVPDATQTCGREVRKLQGLIQAVAKDCRKTEARFAQVSERVLGMRAAMGIADRDDDGSMSGTQVGRFRPVLNQWVSRRPDDKRLQALAQPKQEMEQSAPLHLPPPAAVGARLPVRPRAEEAKPAVAMPQMRQTPRTELR